MAFRQLAAKAAGAPPISDKNGAPPVTAAAALPAARLTGNGDGTA
jgi:hypothetical protein